MQKPYEDLKLVYVLMIIYMWNLVSLAASTIIFNDSLRVILQQFFTAYFNLSRCELGNRPFKLSYRVTYIKLEIKSLLKIHLQ